MEIGLVLGALSITCLMEKYTAMAGANAAEQGAQTWRAGAGAGAR